MKVLAVNANYFLGYNGSAFNYTTRFHRWIRARKVEERSMERLVDMIEQERPDVVCIIEADQGSIFSREDTHVEHVAEKCSDRGLNYSFDYHNKYGNWLSKLPKFNETSNSVLWRGEAEIEAHYLSYGAKQLMHELRFDDVSVFSVHLPLTKKTREKQLRKMAEIIDERDKAIVTGDFNNYHGLEELEDLLQITDLQICETGKTFPAYNPRFMLDFFLVTPNVAVDKSQVMEEYFSDHRPVMLEAQVSTPLAQRILPQKALSAGKIARTGSRKIASKIYSFV